MWWKCVDGKYVNMKHMASLSVEGVGESKYGVYAREVSEQAQYLIKDFDKKEDAEKLAGEIVNAEK